MIKFKPLSLSLEDESSEQSSHDNLPVEKITSESLQNNDQTITPSSHNNTESVQTRS